MYKLFLTLRYLTRKKIVIFPVLVVWLCVMMLIIVSSIMGGFVDRVVQSNHDLYGDIVISSVNQTLGWAGYDELRGELMKDKDIGPHIEATAPVVAMVGLAYVPDAEQTVEAFMVGVNPDEISKVTRFRESLFAQYQAPEQAVADLSPALPATREKLVQFAADRVTAADKNWVAALEAYRKWNEEVRAVEDEIRKKGGDPGGAARLVALRNGPSYWWLIGLVPLTLFVLWSNHDARKNLARWPYFRAVVIGGAGLLIVLVGFLWPLMFPKGADQLEDRVHQADLAELRAKRTVLFAESLPAGTYTTAEDLAKAIVPPKASFAVPQAALDAHPDLPKEGCIVGTQLGFFERDIRGNMIHPLQPRYVKIVVSLSPPSDIGSMGLSASHAVSRQFTLVDDSHTGVYDVDSKGVYAPFETVQTMAGMRADPDIVAKDATANFALRCHQLLIALKGNPSEEETRILRAKINDFVQAFSEHNPQFPMRLIVQTWDEKQARYLGAVKNEKVMITFVLGLMSLVVLVVVFLIFYQIVRDKTRDIGIIKAVGGSEEGVAGIFLTYGLFVGLVGGLLGVITGVVFVQHTNEIHEWIFRVTGIIIWDRSVYLFDRIPDVVRPSEVAVYFIVAVFAGVLGALIPAILAGAEDPVQAVRYE